MPERKPTRTADLDYFYGQSSELFSFYRIPKLLFQDSRFQPLSTDAKTLYGILLDRMSLSARNGWLDKAGRVFIIYTVQEVQDSLGCADKKATKLLRELEEYGLIERKRRGLGRPDLIYVKNFSSESSKTLYMHRDNDDSGTVQNTLQDPAKLRCNKTERNNTEVSDTDPIYSDENDWITFCFIDMKIPPEYSEFCFFSVYSRGSISMSGRLFVLSFTPLLTDSVIAFRLQLWK